MEKILYSYFISEFTRNPRLPISYQRIKRLLSHIAADNAVEYTSGPLYRLLRCGVIDHAADNCFCLSPSLLIEGERHRVGINLNQEIVHANADRILQGSFLGLTVFKNEDLSLGLWDIPVQKYDFEGCWHLFEGLEQIPGSWDPVQEEIDLKNAELYQVSTATWARTHDYPRSGLYKIYAGYRRGDMNNISYCYRCRGRTFRIRKEETERLNLVKTILSAHKLQYCPLRKMILVPDYFPLPTLIERFFFLHHIIEIGSLPSGRSYHMSNSDYRKLNRNVFNNEIKIYNE